MNIIGNGCVVDLWGAWKELEQVEKNNIKWKDRLIISEGAHMVMKGHLEIEKIFEEKLNIGTTKKGIGIAYATKQLRFGIRMGDLMRDDFETKHR